jgi:hypothetical protein
MALGVMRAKLRQPSVVGASAFELKLSGNAAGIERRLERHAVGVDDVGDDAVGFQFPDAALRIPAGGPGDIVVLGLILRSRLTTWSCSSASAKSSFPIRAATSAGIWSRAASHVSYASRYPGDT